jgi:dTDP-4-dehydrorhamnose 3,5-epimerase-like enzyme
MLKNLDSFTRDDGCLFALNEGLGIPVKRFFYIKDIPKNSTRGHHAHIKNNQLLVCINGKILVTMKKGDGDESQVTLTTGQTFLLENMTWATQTYLTGEDVLLVLCSEVYDEKDYIRNYEKYLELLCKLS